MKIYEIQIKVYINACNRLRKKKHEKRPEKDEISPNTERQESIHKIIKFIISTAINSRKKQKKNRQKWRKNGTEKNTVAFG